MLIKFGLGVLFGMCLAGAIIVLAEERTIMYHSGYRQGQIDYYNGKIKYKLEVQDDGSIVWGKHETK